MKGRRKWYVLLLVCLLVGYIANVANDSASMLISESLVLNDKMTWKTLSAVGHNPRRASAESAFATNKDNLPAAWSHCLEHTKALFVGHSHVRELMCRVIGVVGIEACSKAWKHRNSSNGNWVDSLNDPYLMNVQGQGKQREMLRSPLAMIGYRSPTPAPSDDDGSEDVNTTRAAVPQQLSVVVDYDLIVVGRGAWDAIYNSTNPHDVYVSTKSALKELLRWVRHVREEDGDNGDGRLSPKVVLYLPHYFHQPTRAVFRSCVKEGRIQAYRAAIERAAAEANYDFYKSTGGAMNGGIFVFDAYEMTKRIPRTQADGWGHHYRGGAQDAIVNTLLLNAVSCGVSDDALGVHSELIEFRRPRRLAFPAELPGGPSSPSCACARNPFHYSCPIWSGVLSTGSFQRSSDRTRIMNAYICTAPPKDRAQRFQHLSLLRRVCDAPAKRRTTKRNAVRGEAKRRFGGAVKECLRLQGWHSQLETADPDLGPNSDAVELALELLRGKFVFPSCSCVSKTHFNAEIEKQLSGLNVSRDDIAAGCGSEFATVESFVASMPEGSICEELRETKCWSKWYV